MPDSKIKENMKLEELLQLIHKKVSYFDVFDPVELAQFKSDKDSILRHQSEMKSDMKEMKKGMTDILAAINADKLSVQKQIGNLEKDIESLKTKVGIFFTIAGGFGALMGWVFSTIKILKG